MSATRSRTAAVAVIAGALTLGYLAQGTFAAGTPANKVAGSGSSTETLGAGSNGDLEKVVLSETVRINNPTDLIISATAECAIMTQVINGATAPTPNSTERAYGQVKFYVKIDGIRVLVAKDDADNGEVVFCERAQEQQWTDTQTGDDANDDNADRMRQYLNTRSANGFNWMALNVGTNYPGINGTNVHKIELWAHWQTKSTTNAIADAFVGNRTLILEPVKAAHGETVTGLN